MCLVSGRGRVLIADRKADARIAVSRLLEESGFSVKVVSSALEIRAQLDSFQPDLLLMDTSIVVSGGHDLVGAALDRGLAVILTDGEPRYVASFVKDGNILSLVFKPVEAGGLSLTIDDALAAAWGRRRAGPESQSH
jgi:DNA-binding NtrC family response regulator